MKTDLELRIDRSTAMTCLKRAYLHLAQRSQSYIPAWDNFVWRNEGDGEAAGILGRLHNEIGREALDHDLAVAKGKTK